MSMPMFAHVRRAAVHTTRTLCAGVLLALSTLAAPLHAAETPFTLWVAETPAGGTAPFANQAAGGVRAYVFDLASLSYSAGPQVSAAALDDPSDVLVDNGGNLVIANRHFNTGNGSIAQVAMLAGTPTTVSTLIASTPAGPHQLALTAANGLVVSSFNAGGLLYPDQQAPATVSFASGAQRGAVVMGDKLYTTNGANTVSVWDLATGANLQTTAIVGAGGLHYGTAHDGSLFFADIASDSVYRLALDSNGLVAGSTGVALVDDAIDLIFSPGGTEMFVIGHRTGQITGFQLDASGNVVGANLLIDGGLMATWAGEHVSFGGAAVTATAVPEAGTGALLAAGLLVLAGCGAQRRRQTSR